MIVTCEQGELSKGLGMVSRAVPARNPLPITSNVLISTRKSSLALAATDLEVSIGCNVLAKVKEEGAIAIPARLFADFIHTLPQETVTITMGALTHTIEVKCGRFQCRISGTDAAEFPPLPLLSVEGVNTQIDTSALRLAIAQVAFAAATEDTRPVLTGCLCEFDGDTLTLAAADGFRLAVHKAPLSQSVVEQTSIIIPARALHELHRLLADRDEPVGVTINPARSQVLFSLKDVEMVSQLIQGTFPNYVQLIPETTTTTVMADRYQLLSAMRTAATMASHGNSAVRVEMAPPTDAGPGVLFISAQAQEIGDNQGQLSARVGGEITKIAFNYRYVLDVLRSIDTNDVAISVAGSVNPAVFRPVGNDRYVHIIMPMSVRW